MGFARIYVGAHYPWDVLAGYALGAIVALAGYTLARPVLNLLFNAIAEGPLGPLVAREPTASGPVRG